MKYKILKIKGYEKDYRRRVYIITQKELNDMKGHITFVIRQGINGEKIYYDTEYDKMYCIIEHEGMSAIELKGISKDRQRLYVIFNHNHGEFYSLFVNECNEREIENFEKDVEKYLLTHYGEGFSEAGIYEEVIQEAKSLGLL